MSSASHSSAGSPACQGTRLSLQTKETHLGTGIDPLGGIVTGKAKAGLATRVGTTEPSRGPWPSPIEKLVGATAQEERRPRRSSRFTKDRNRRGFRSEAATAGRISSVSTEPRAEPATGDAPGEPSGRPRVTTSERRVRSDPGDQPSKRQRRPGSILSLEPSGESESRPRPRLQSKFRKKNRKSESSPR